MNYACYTLCSYVEATFVYFGSQFVHLLRLDYHKVRPILILNVSDRRISIHEACE